MSIMDAKKKKATTTQQQTNKQKYNQSLVVATALWQLQHEWAVSDQVASKNTAINVDSVLKSWIQCQNRFKLGCNTFCEDQKQPDLSNKLTLPLPQARWRTWLFCAQTLKHVSRLPKRSWFFFFFYTKNCSNTLFPCVVRHWTPSALI